MKAARNNFVYHVPNVIYTCNGCHYFLSCTVWKFHDFSITQILREINFWGFRSAKSAILTHLEALNCNFRSLKYVKSIKFRASKIIKMAFLALLHSPNLISRKIWVTEKWLKEIIREINSVETRKVRCEKCPINGISKNF